MDLIVRGACGYEIRAPNEPDLIRDTQIHAKDAHDMALTDEQVLAIMEVEQ
jgi:predicted small metal-binding protein